MSASTHAVSPSYIIQLLLTCWIGLEEILLLVLLAFAKCEFGILCQKFIFETAILTFNSVVGIDVGKEAVFSVIPYPSLN